MCREGETWEHSVLNVPWGLFTLLFIIIVIRESRTCTPQFLSYPHTTASRLPTACALSWNSIRSTSCCHCVLRAIHWSVGSPTRATLRKTDLPSSSSQLSSFILQTESDIAHVALISTYQRLDLNFLFFWLYRQCAGITGMRRHTQLPLILDSHLTVNIISSIF